MDKFNKVYLEDINYKAVNDPVEFMRQGELYYRDQVKNVVSLITPDEGIDVVMLAGPSSSGKTTTAKNIKREYEKTGHNAFVISLDDFYKHRDEVPFGDDGMRDFECAEALNLELLETCIENLVNKGESALPEFDFVSGLRKDDARRLVVTDGDVVIFEGLHALKPDITKNINVTKDDLTKVYISVETRVFDREDSVILTRHDIRLFRRLNRDFHYRGSSCENTFNMWPKVVQGEFKYTLQFKDEADIKFDTFHPYELCIYKDMILPILHDMPENSPFYYDVKNYLSFFERINSLDPQLVPKDSLLQEFIKL